MAAEKKRIGRQTPTKSFVLPYKKSLSDEAVALYSQTGRTAMEWQSLLLKDIMAVNDDGCWTHMTVGYSIPRRNGKTEDVYMREIWGLHKGEQILHTAHENSTSHASFESLVDLLNDMGYEEKKDYIKNSALGNERITMIETKGVIKYRTRTKVGGLGLGFDLLVVDEAQEYTDTHRSALEYTISSSQNPQAIMLGTPPDAEFKGDGFCTVQRRLPVRIGRRFHVDRMVHRTDCRGQDEDGSLVRNKSVAWPDSPGAKRAPRA